MFHVVLLYLLYLYTFLFFFFFNDTATTEIYTLSLHDALPIYFCIVMNFIPQFNIVRKTWSNFILDNLNDFNCIQIFAVPRSEEHTSELQSRPHLVCRLLLEKKKSTKTK